MKLERYGIILSRLTKSNIELVRKWRTHPQVNRNFEYRKPITQEQQLRWFESIDNHQNYFYLIEYRGRKTGLISTFDINWEAMTAHGGIFMWDDTVTETPIPVYAVLAMLDFNFKVLGLQRMYIKVKSTNRKAIIYNKKLGYKLLPGQKGRQFQNYYLNKKNYTKSTNLLHKVAQKLTGMNTTITINKNATPELYGLLSGLSPEQKEAYQLTINFSQNHTESGF